MICRQLSSLDGNLHMFTNKSLWALHVGRFLTDQFIHNFVDNTKQTFCSISVPVMGYDSCWFFGDDFAKRSFEQNFHSRPSTEYNGYIKAHFDTRGFFLNFLCDNPSLIG